MKLLWKTSTSLLCALALAACSSTTSAPHEDEAPEGQLEPVRTLTIPTAQSFMDEMDEGDDARRPILVSVTPAADISARNRPEFDLYEEGYDPEKEPIKVELLNFWDDAGNYFANVNYKNSGQQVNKTIYIFGYDRLGRLVETRVQNTFFRTHQNLVRTERFPKSGAAVRWTVLVKN